MNRLSMSEAPVLTKVRSNKSKRVLQVLQVSASDKDLLVSPSLMSGKQKKTDITQKKAEVSHDGLLSKENTPVMPTVRRSKRKNVAAQEQVKKVTSKEGTETKACSNRISKVTKPKKATTKTNKKISPDLKQSKMDSFIANASTSNTIFESKLEEDASSVNDKEKVLQPSKNLVEVAVSPIKALSCDTTLQDFKDSGIVITPNMLISSNPPESYWKMLAEERKVALEEALRENEQLFDQLQVLETENSQLKSCLKEAEKLAEVLRQALD